VIYVKNFIRLILRILILEEHPQEEERHCTILECEFDTHFQAMEQMLERDRRTAPAIPSLSVSLRPLLRTDHLVLNPTGVCLITLFPEGNMVHRTEIGPAF
jgi:hypothetical protein